MSQWGNSPSNNTGCPLRPCRTFEGILPSPNALLSPDGKLHTRLFTRKRKAVCPPSDDTGGKMQAKCTEAELHLETGGDKQIALSGQLPLAAVIPPKEPRKDEWWTVLGNSSLDVSAILQRAFLKTDTGREVAEQNGFRLADMVTSVSASCGLSYSAICSAPTQQQKLRTCIEEIVEDHFQLPATEPAPVCALPTVSKPTSDDGKQAPPCSPAVLPGTTPGDAVKISIMAQKPAPGALSLPSWPVASARDQCIDTAQEGVPCATNKLKREPPACDEDIACERKVTVAAARSHDGCAVLWEQPVAAAQKASKKLKPMSAVPPKVEAVVCKQDEIQTTCKEEGADHATKGLSSVCGAQSTPALDGLNDHIEIPQHKTRSRRPKSASQSQGGFRTQSGGRRQGVKAASSGFHRAAAASEMTANTAQPEALHRLLESTKRCNWGSHRSIKQINNDHRSHVNYKPQSGYY